MGLLEKATKKEDVTAVRYETELDKIYYEIKKSGDASLKELSSRLNIPRDKLEDYAKILDEQGLLKLYYPSIGSPKLIKKGVMKKANKKRNFLIFTVVLVLVTAAVIVYLKLYVI